MQTRQAELPPGANFKFKRGIPADQAGRNFDEGRSCDRQAYQFGQTTRQHFVSQHAYMLGVILELNDITGIVRTTQQVGLRGAPHAPDNLSSENFGADRLSTQAWRITVWLGLRDHPRCLTAGAGHRVYTGWSGTPALSSSSPTL